MNIHTKRITRTKFTWLTVLAGFSLICLLLASFLLTLRLPNDPIPIQEKLTGLTLPFISNQGQTDPAVAYYASTFAGTVFVTHQGELVYSMPGPSTNDNIIRKEIDGWTLIETLVDGQPRPQVEQLSTTGVSYFIGDDPLQWHSGVPTHDSISLGEAWPGIELTLRAHADTVEKIFTVMPGADVNNIRLRLDGASSVIPGDDGSLKVTTGFGDVSFSAPLAWQNKTGQRKPVQVAYALNEQGYGFNLGRHDPTLPVMIDPLLQSTYLGGSELESAWGLAIHTTSNDLLVAGHTQSLDFPGTTGGYQADAGAGIPNLFIARISADLKTLHQVTYLGGSGGEYGYGLALHPSSSQVYVSGLTSSTDFPETTGGAQSVSGGSHDVFVARFNTNLTTLFQSTYLGGDNTEQPYDLAIHPISGDIYVYGDTHSDNFPQTIGGAQPLKDDFRDTFIAHLNENLTTLEQATYLGAGGNDSGQGLTFHPTTGDVYVTGYVGYALNDLPGVTGGAQATRASDDDEAFVSRLSEDLKTLFQSTYFGGTRGEVGYNIAINPTSDTVYISGYTRSDDLPGTTGGGTSGIDEGFVASFNSGLTTLNQSTYLVGGGSGKGDMAVHPISAEIYVIGITSSVDFPGTTGGAQPANAGLIDAYVSRFSSDLQTLLQSTYIGGSSNDYAHALLLHPISGDVYLTGETSSTSDFPMVLGSAQPDYNGGSRDAFISHLDASLSGADTTPDAFSFTDQTDVNLNTLVTSNTITVSGIEDSTSISISAGEYSIDGGAYTNATATVINGQAVTLQLTSSASFSSTTDATLTIGGISDTFSVSTMVNNSPSAPQLVAPTNDAINVDGSSVTFEWLASVDPDGDDVSYQLSYCTNNSFTGCDPVDVAWYQQPANYLIALSGSSGLLVMSVFSPFASRRRRGFQIAILILVSLLFNACGGGGSNDDENDDTTNPTHNISSLTAGTTYYWKVAADDGKGGRNESDVWSFTTQ